MDSAGRDELERCQEVLREMEEEIGLLRNASMTFGELADRLNQQVQILRSQLHGRDEGRSATPPTAD